MAITTDTGAKKIENSENWRHIFGIHNDTVDAYDALAEQKDEEIGIVVKGNKTAHTGGAAAGQYIILRNSTITGCDDGLYTAAQAIPYDTVIDSTYLTPVSGGGLNALNASIATLPSSYTNTYESNEINSETTYTATSDCVVIIRGNTNSSGAVGLVVKIDNVQVYQFGSGNAVAYGCPFTTAVTLLRGQTLKITPDRIYCYYLVYA